MFDNLLIDEFDLKTLDNILLAATSSSGVCEVQYQPGAKCNLLYKVSDLVVAGCVVVSGIVGATCEIEETYFSEDMVKQGSKLFESIVGLTFEDLSCKIGIDAVTEAGQPVLKEKTVGTVRGRLSSPRSEGGRVIVPGAVELSTNVVFMGFEEGGTISLGDKLVKGNEGYLVVSKVLRKDSIGGHHYEIFCRKEV